MNVFDLVAKLSLDSSEYEKGLGNSEKSASTFGQKLKNGIGTATKVGAAAIGAVTTAVVATGAAMVKQTGEVAAYGDNIDKMSQKLGLSAEAYQQWDYVLGQAGTDIQSMSTGMKTLTNKLDDAKNGSQSAQEMFAKLGLSLEDLQGMSREDAFEAVITGFQGMADSTERAALANDLFGKSGQELTPLFNSSIEDTQALLQASKDLGFVMSNDSVKAAADYQDALDTMKRTMGGVKTSIISGFMPSITQVMDGLTQVFGGDSGKGVRLITGGITSIINKIGESAPKIMEVGKSILSALYEAIMTNLPQITQGGTELIIGLVKGLVSNLPTLVTTAGTMILTIVQTIWTHLPELWEAGKEAVMSLVGGIDPAALIERGGEILDSFLQKIFEYLPKLLESGVKFVSNMANGIAQNAPHILASITSVLNRLISTIMTNLPKFLQKGVELIGRMISGIAQNTPAIISQLVGMLASLTANIASRLPEFLQKGIELIGQMAAGIVRAIPTIVSKIPQIFNDIKAKLGSFDWGGIGRNIIDGIKNGLSNAAHNLISAAKDAVKAAFDAMKGFLGIKSPSKLAEQVIGKNWALGIGEGFDKYFPIGSMIDSVKDAFGQIESTETQTGDTVAQQSATDSRLYGLLVQLLGEVSKLVGAGVYLDGKTLVGHLVPAIDTAMGTTVGYADRGIA